MWGNHFQPLSMIIKFFLSNKCTEIDGERGGRREREKRRPRGKEKEKIDEAKKYFLINENSVT